MEKKIMETEKRKSLPIVEVQQALNDWYDLRFNEITGIVEGRKKDETDYKVEKPVKLTTLCRSKLTTPKRGLS